MVRFTRLPSWSYPQPTHRLPEHYYRHRQALTEPSTRVYDRPPETDLLDLKYDDQLKRVIRVADLPIKVLYPPEADQGLWGGEGIVKGYIKPRKYHQAGWPRPRFWFPNLKRAVLYSEILDKHFSVICTKRTLTLIDDYYGLDDYILRSPVQDLKSQLALMLRRTMWKALDERNFTDPAHGEEMLKKYGDTLPPREEIEWFGLSVKDALLKQKIIDAKAAIRPPLKYELARNLLEELKSKPKEELKEARNISMFERLKSTFRRDKY